MKKKTIENDKKRNSKKSPIFLIALFNFLVVILISIYIIYLRFIPYQTITYSGFAVSGKDIANNLLNSNFDVQENITALEVKDQDEIFKKLKNYYIGADKKNDINLNYPIYVNDTLALYNLSSNVFLYTDDLRIIEGYKGFTLTSGALYNANTLERADYYDYILMKNSDGMYINTKEMKIQTSSNKYNIKMNSIINFTDEYITYYTLQDGKFVYGKIIDIDENSKIEIKDYNKKYSYKEFLIGLDIIKEETKTNDDIEENTIKQEKEEEKKEENVDKQENTIQMEQIVENTVTEENKEPITEQPEEPEKPNEDNTKWQKPTVSCTDFVPSVYTATTEVSISDPSGAICKALTFNFYQDGEIVFRSSATSSGTFKVAKLIPDSKYTVVGTYQYENETGGIIEVKFLDQEFETLNTKNIKPIELSFINGPIYSNKIQLLDLKINSDTTDEAISGVSRAEIIINKKPYSISTTFLRGLLKGNTQKYETEDELKSSSKYDYEIVFYDTANNEMKLTNNKGTTVTSKAKPEVKVKLEKQNIISFQLGITLKNEDKIDLYNYRYIIYSSTGEICKQDNLSVETDTLFFDDMDPEETYTIKVYADFDIDDGNGLQENQEIGDAIFTTVSLSKLGSLKFNMDYDIDKDLKYNSININTSINRTRTDGRLIKILKEVNIEITDDNNHIIKTTKITDINNLSTEGIINEITNLESNTNYNINITAKAHQGNVIEEVVTSYTLNSFTTKKMPVDVNIKNVVVTNRVIDFDIKIYDKDGASLNGEYVVELRDKDKNLIEAKIIKCNEYTRCTYEELNKDEEYTLKCYASVYNDTNDEKLAKGNFVIDTKKFITKGLSGKIDLQGLDRQNIGGKNIIDVKSNNNWYSKCFDVLTREYVTDKDGNTTFKIDSKTNYDKIYDDNTKTLTLTSNQCYVYNLKDYAGKKATLSFKAKVSNDSIKDSIYIQKGKELGRNTDKLTGLTTSYGERYEMSLVIPEDGYIGFYLSADNQETLSVQELQVELGNVATEYEDYNYDLNTNIDIDFYDEKYVTFDGKEDEQLYSKYFIRFIYSDKSEEYVYKEMSSTVKNKKSYKIDKLSESTKYTIQILIKVYDRDYILDEISFNYNPTSCDEIKSINSVEEFKDIQPYGNYIVLKDLSLVDSNSSSEYTFGNPNISFYGSIDFNGKNIEKDVYSSVTKTQSTTYMFYNLAQSANIKNIVYNVYIDNINPRYDIDILDGIYPLFLYNDGTIDNIIVQLKGCNKVDKRYVTLMGYENRTTGIINDFIVDLKNILYGTKDIATVSLYSSGNIQNGYMYGSGIQSVEEIVHYDSRNIAGIVYEVKAGGILQNVYNLCGITLNHQPTTNSYAANMVFNVAPGAIVRNIYSLKEYTTIFENFSYDKLFDVNNKEIEKGLNIFNNAGNVQFSYYFSGTTYEDNTYNTKQDLSILNDYNFQDNLLNANGFKEFNIEKYVKNGYYPQLRLNVCMPLQEKISIENSKDNEIMDVLASEIVKFDTLDNQIKEELKDYNFDDENVQVARFTVYNPSGKTITQIGINYMDSKVVYQTYSKKMSTVYAVLNNPTSFINEYNISSITGKNISGKEKTLTYGKDGDLGERTIKVSFVKYIKTAEEWDKIDSEDENGISGLIQNYKLDADINFENSDYSPSIRGVFEGTFDGQGHTLSNISSNACLFYDYRAPSFKNLNVNGYELNKQTTNYGAGLIATIQKDAVIDNIHIQNAKLYSKYTSAACFVGGICGHVSEAVKVKLTNSSINGLEINFTDKSATVLHRIGGLIGYSNNIQISNCYVQGLNITTTDSIANTRIGGIIAETSSSSTVQYCYTQGNIITGRPSVGGIFGYGNFTTQYCYSLVNITGNMTSGEERIGGIGGSGSSGTTTNNLYLGNTYIKDSVINNSRRIVGNNTSTGKKNNYGYVNQIINGKKTTELLGATELLTHSRLFEQSTYTDANMLNFGTICYDYDQLTTGNILPKLKYYYEDEENINNGELLPNQLDNYVENGLKIISSDYQKSETQEEVKISLELENVDELTLEDINFIFEDDGFILKKDEKITITHEKINDINITKVVFIVVPNRCYDTYKLTGIKYRNRMGEDKVLETEIQIATQFYKEIWNADEWNEKTSTIYPENYRIMGDIDFSTVETIQSNVCAGRLIADETKIISNADLTFDKDGSGLITEVKTELKNISFNNITISADNYSEIGVISRVNATISNCSFSNIDIQGLNTVGSMALCSAGSSMENIELNHVKISGRSYVGGVSGKVSSSGTFKNIIGKYVSVTATATDSHCAGLFANTTGAGTFENLKVYQYSETGKKDTDTETEHLVKGINYVGGCVGNTGFSLINLETRYSTITTGNKSGRNIAGCVSWISGSNTVENIISTNNIINGNNSTYVGGCIGWLYAGKAKQIISQDNELIKGGSDVGGAIGIAYMHFGKERQYENIVSSNNKEIKGRKNVGGTIGKAGYATVEGAYAGSIANIISYNNNNISANDNVGGCIGSSTIKIKNAKTYYDNISVEPNIIGNNYVGGIIGLSEYSSRTNDISMYAFDGAYAKNVNILGVNAVGGFSGAQRGSIYAVAVDNCIIYASGDNAGGITGSYQGSTSEIAEDYACKTFSLMHSFCTNSTVQANSNAGGLVGDFVFGNIQYCYVGNTDVTAVEKYAGGLVGYFNNSNMSSKQYVATIKYNFIANVNNDSVSSLTGVGGLIGAINKDLYVDEEKDEDDNVISRRYYIQSNLVVTDIESTTDYVSMGIGKVDSTGALGSTQSGKLDGIYVYEGSYLISKDSNKYQQVNFNEDERNRYILLSSNELSDINTYKSTEGLNFVDEKERYKFEKKYFPLLNVLDSDSTQTYWGEEHLNVIQNKIRVPDTQLIETMDEVSNFSMMRLNLSSSIQLPKVDLYAVDIDKINIEFNQTNPYIYFDVKTSDGKVIIERINLTERVYTLSYDFNTDLIITISNLENWYTKTVSAKNIRNLLDILGDEYIYIQNNNIYSNKRDFEGEYVNIFNGKALSLNGNIYDISTMNIIEKNKNEIKLLDEQIPIAKSNYEGIEIHTFYHCSKVIQGTNECLYKDQQIFIKNGTMYLADGNLDSIGNAIIIDSYNGKDYETILATDGRLYDLLTGIKYPQNFKNENIIAMTNNINSNNNIVLVYYSTGRVYGFNYITGEEVYDNNIGEQEVGIFSYIVRSFDFKDALYETKKSNYKEAEKFVQKLESVSINQAIEEINEKNDYELKEENIVNGDNLTHNNNDTDKSLPSKVTEKYMTTYDAKTQSYVVYSTSELLIEKIEKTKSENEKINGNDDLISYYTNMSTSKIKLKDLGMALIALIVVLICISLIAMYKKNNKQNR